MIDEQLYYSSVANLLQYLCAKIYQNTTQLDKVIAKNKRVQFFSPHSVDTFYVQYLVSVSKIPWVHFWLRICVSIMEKYLTHHW